MHVLEHGNRFTDIVKLAKFARLSPAWDRAHACHCELCEHSRGNRHCEERSDEAIQWRNAGLLHFARNDT